ncbi:MAG TPA: FecR domain-containing protein, partial [Acidobacteriota bacterium]|nr:FecR domain-containing protein [Acidobacteriota bacterium]
MKFDETEKELLVDQAIDSVRSVRPPAERMNRSVQRVRERLSSADASLLDCEDFQALMSDFLAGDLAETRRLLLEDHIGGCPRCRRRLQAIAAGPSERPVHSAPPVARRPWIQWGGIAAALLLSFFLLRTALVDGPAYLSAEAWSVVEDSQGPLFRLAGSDLIPLSPGERLEASTPIRTGSGSTALLKMADGTSIEISERAQLQIRRGWRGNHIHLERGAIIVEAAEQGRGRLSVNTTDVRVDVKGTVFSVSHGLKGSRVSVLEGEVRIREGAHEFSMKAGEQFASGRKLSAAPIAGEISWSRNADSHMELLGRLHEIGFELQQASFSDSLRYSSELIGLIPAPPVFVAAVPNLTSQLDEVMAELSGRMAHDPILAEWLAGRFTDEHGNDIGALVERFQTVGERLGPEVVLAVVEGPASDFAPLLLTTTEDAAGLEQVIWAEVNRLATEHPEGLPIVVTRDLTGHSEAAEIWILLHGRLVTASTSRELLQQVAAIFDRQSVGSFAGSQFHQTLMEEYAQGIDWLI